MLNYKCSLALAYRNKHILKYQGLTHKPSEMKNVGLKLGTYIIMSLNKCDY